MNEIKVGNYSPYRFSFWNNHRFDGNIAIGETKDIAGCMAGRLKKFMFALKKIRIWFLQTF